MIFDNSASNQAFMARAVAHLLAMQEVRVQFPLNALMMQDVGKVWYWRLHWAQKIAGSNPAVLTKTHDAVGSVLVRMCGC